jgi:hypothetical protein
MVCVETPAFGFLCIKKPLGNARPLFRMHPRNAQKTTHPVSSSLKDPHLRDTLFLMRTVSYEPGTPVPRPCTGSIHDTRSA